MSEAIEAGLGRCLDDFVPVASACHPLAQIAQPFLDKCALFHRDQWMIQRKPDMENG